MDNQGYEVSDAAIAALTNMSAQMTELAGAIHDAVESLKQTFEENRAGLGPHTASIEKLLEELADVEEDASNPVKILVLKLTRAALIRKRSLTDDPYSLGTGGRSR